MKIKKEIIYPIFIQVSQLSNDTYWYSIFNNLARGITPNGVIITETNVCNRFKEKSFTYEFENKSPKEIHDELKHLFQKKMGLQSKMDYLKNKKKFNLIMEKDEYIEWKDIKIKNIKDILIENYALELRKKYDLTIRQTDELLNFISLSLIFKELDKGDIIYKCGKIINIKNLHFSKESGEFFISHDEM